MVLNIRQSNQSEINRCEHSTILTLPPTVVFWAAPDHSIPEIYHPALEFYSRFNVDYSPFNWIEPAWSIGAMLE